MEQLAEKLLKAIRKEAYEIAIEHQDGRWSWFEGRQYAELATETDALDILVELCKEIYIEECESFETSLEREANGADFRRKDY